MLEAFYVLTVSFLPPLKEKTEKARVKRSCPQPGLLKKPETVTIPLNMRVIKQKVNPLPVSTQGNSIYIEKVIPIAIAKLK